MVQGEPIMGAGHIRAIRRLVDSRQLLPNLGVDQIGYRVLRVCGLIQPIHPILDDRSAGETPLKVRGNRKRYFQSHRSLAAAVRSERVAGLALRSSYSTTLSISHTLFSSY